MAFSRQATPRAHSAVALSLALSGLSQAPTGRGLNRTPFDREVLVCFILGVLHLRAAAPTPAPCRVSVPPPSGPRANTEWFPTTTTRLQLAAWSSGMILASGARGPGLNSRSSPPPALLSGAAAWVAAQQFRVWPARVRPEAGHSSAGGRPAMARHRLAASLPPRRRQGVGNPRRHGSLSSVARAMVL